MPQLRTPRTLAMLSAGAAALALAACNQSSPSQNGSYVAASTGSSAPTGGQPLPPSTEYQAVANTPPPPLPVYDQPPIPGPGYVWTPGYWDWSDSVGDYYWVPGTWIEPPSVGDLWTPGYWRFYNGRYLFSDGYWGPQVGFYGGVDYGYGYGGSGYAGGRWQGNQFYYNTEANNLGRVRVGATYSEALSRNATRVSFNGGPGGLQVAPVQAEIAAAQARHSPPTPGQREQARTAIAEPQLRASVNRGSPPIAASTRPAAFSAGVTGARSAASYTPPASPGQAPGVPRPRVEGSPMPARPDQPTGRPSTSVGPRAPEAPERALPAARPAAVVAERPAPSETMRAGPPNRPVQEPRAVPSRAPAPQQAREPAPKAAERPAAPHEQDSPDRPR